jgi:Spy/CpxP family protein refolding chaperone
VINASCLTEPEFRPGAKGDRSVKANLIKFGLAAFAVVSIVASQALPQQFSTQNGPSGATVAIGGMVAGNMSRAAILASLLGLTAHQQDQAKEIFDEEQSVTRPLVDQLKEATDALASAEKTAPNNPDIDLLATNMANISGQLLAVDAEAESQIYALLTDGQRQKLDQLPHPLFVPSGPLFPPGPVFAMSSGHSGQ